MTDSPPTSIHSEDDETRKELMWTARSQTYVQGVSVRCRAASARHSMLARRKKIAYQIIGIPSTVLPIISIIWQTAKCETALISTILVVTGSSCSAVSAFLNLGQKAQQHKEYSNRFQELADEIDSMLCKPKAGRIASDVFLERIQNKFSSLSRCAP